MCSFLFTNNINFDLDYVNRFMKLRGPDSTDLFHINGNEFVHNLLSITGSFIQQPFVDDNDEIVCVYNGQIYNYDSDVYASDGECIIPLYKEYGLDFVNHLDGEFAICLVDYLSKQIILVSDCFATKPMWYSFEGGKFAIASYESGVLRLGFNQAEKIEANTIRVYDLNTLDLVHDSVMYDFDLNQHKYSFDDWVHSFEDSIRKRTKNIREGLFIGLSSGYDSGSISCELNKQGVNYKSYSVLSRRDDHNLIKERALKNKEYEILKDNRWVHQKHLNENVEEFLWRIYSSSSDYNEFGMRLQEDNGSVGLAMICDEAKKEERKIYLSGSGSDEIFSDYGFGGNKIYAHSNFGGLFPKNLSSIFPWASFYGSSMVSYLAKEEYVAGSYGIETRYPFLDKDVVQEFLWLSSDLKNSKYKSVLDEYMSRNGYAFNRGVKNGFS